MTKIAVLTRDKLSNDPSLKIFRLLEKKFNFQLIVINPLDIDLNIRNKKENFLFCRGKKIYCDIIWPRIGTENTYWEFLTTVNVLDYLLCQTNIRIINSVAGTLISNNKFQQLLLTRNLTKIPRSSLINNCHQLENILEKTGLPAVAKRLYGHGGSGIFLLDSRGKGLAKIRYFLKRDRLILIQQFLQSKDKKDYRVYVVGRKVIGGITRHPAKKNEFRSNTALGGLLEFFQPDKKIRGLALKIAKAADLEIVAVDFMKYKNEYVFIELNESYSVKPYEKAHKVVAEEIIKYLISQVRTKS